MDSVSKALALARIGVKVFPVTRSDRSPAIPYREGGRGFYDATSDDFEKIATWFTLDYPDAVVGVWSGGSGLVTTDIDRKNGKDGFKTLEEGNYELTPTEHYETASGGGEHHVYASDRVDLTLAKGVFHKDSGIDIRAGGSYFVWWGDEVPESRAAFSTDIPAWVIEAATPKDSESTAEGFSGSVTAWLETLPDDILPSGRVRDLLERIPKDDFGHAEMIDLVWSLVRLGSERETGISTALDRLRSEWLRGKYDTPQYRHDFDMALRGAINKGGRLQNPVPAMIGLSAALAKAGEVGVAEALKTLERKVSETGSEIEFARARREMFKIAAKANLSPATSLGIVTGSKAFKLSKVSIESAWFGDGEPEFHDSTVVEEDEPEEAVDHEAELAKLVTNLAKDSESFSFLTEDEQALVASKAYDWFGTEYQRWVQTRLKHYNAPYHIGSMWAMLSVIVSPWGKVPLQGARPTDCNLYFTVLGESSSGKSEAWDFAKAMIDAFFGTEHSPIVGDTKKTSALSLHRTLILRDGEPSLVYSDEVQSFFKDLQNSHWQGSILGDLSDYYGGNVPPKNTMNDKEISGKRAKTLLTTYFTGIADMALDAVSLDNWRDGFFYRFLWAFGYPRATGDFRIKLETMIASYSAQFDDWAREFRRVEALQEVRWGAGRIVDWEDDALERIIEFNEQLDVTVRPSPLYDTVFIPANGRFLVSIMKCATIVALTEASEKVTLRHALIAINAAGPWHRSMVLAVSETGKEMFDREVEKCLLWIKRNAIRQVGKKPWIQRTAVMRAFKPNEIAERLLRQLCEEGWLIRSADTYEVQEG